MSILKTIYLQHLNGSTPNATLDANGNMTVTGTVAGAYSDMFRNRIINGDMRIDQRNAGAAITSDAFAVDRWMTYFNSGTVSRQQSSVAPPGFTNSLGITVTSAGNRNATSYCIIQQVIEGYNISDFDMGLSSAKTVTLSFWVRSSLIGLYSGAITTSDNTALYAFTYTINSANTWQYITVTIPGYTSGTWYKTNGVGTLIRFDLGSGSNYQASSLGSWVSGINQSGVSGTVGFGQTLSATFYITGVQLEVGTVATPFERRPYGTELALCQRYAYKITRNSNYPLSMGNAESTTRGYVSFIMPVVMRATPTVTQTGYTAYTLRGTTSDVACSSGGFGGILPWLIGAELNTGTAHGAPAGGCVKFSMSSDAAYILAEAEL